MTDPIDNMTSSDGFLAMFGIPDQRCCNGNAMVVQTTVGAAEVEALLRDLLPQVLQRDLGPTTQIDRRSLGEIEPSALLQRVKTNVHALHDLRLPADSEPKTLIQQVDLLKAMAAGQKPQLREEILRAAGTICQEAAQRLRRTFDEAATRAPSQVDAVLEDWLQALNNMDIPSSLDGKAMAVLENRAEQLTGLGRLRPDLKETTYLALQRRLRHAAQAEYAAALEEIISGSFQQCWKREREVVKERCGQHLEDCRTYRARIRMCADQFDRAFQRARQRLTTLRAGNQVVLGEPSSEDLLAAIMTHRKLGSQAELLDALRHDLEERLREAAARHGMAHHDVPFRRLLLALPVGEVADAFRGLIVESISGTHSFYETCQTYGLDRLASELVKRSQITSWFDGRDDSRFGIARFQLTLVRMPSAANPKDAQIKELMEGLFRQAGFHQLLTNGHERSLSVLRIYAGWPVGIEGGNTALLEAYGRSQQTGHLPHVVGILPDSQAGEHAPGILKLLGQPDQKERANVSIPSE